jgi:aminoglycoside phosphotransferase (APT) family kinase protein
MAVDVEQEGSAFPTDKVVAWLRDQGVDLVEPVRVDLISGGRSNLTYGLIGADGEKVVLRRPPFGHVLESAHDMSREWRFITALRDTPVPVARVLATASDPEPLGVSFYVMTYVDGLVPHDASAASTLSEPVRTAFATNLVDTMAALHAVDIDAVGLGDIARREDYVGRQLKRWKRQWDQSSSTHLTVVDAAYDKLHDMVPEQQGAVIAHGDFRPGNMIVGPDGTIRAVLDWELATLGDPLADLAWMLSGWVDELPEAELAAPGAPPSALPGFPTREWMLERYRQQTGLDVSRFDYYLAFCAWRGACISAGVLNRYEVGVMGDDGFDFSGMRRSIADRGELAVQLLDRL